MPTRVTIAALQQMKRDGLKIAGVVVYDYPMARIVDRAGVDLISVGDSVGVNMWGHASDDEVTLDEMLVVCKAVRRGSGRAIVSCDLPTSVRDIVGAARVLVDKGGAAMVKVDADPQAVRALVDAGITVWAQIDGNGTSDSGGAHDVTRLVHAAQMYEEAGASMLDFRHSGPVAGPAVTKAVAIPVLGGLGGGPWLDGRVRAVVNAIGYNTAALDIRAERYANIARAALEAITAYTDDVRAGRQIKGK
jgi:3-methyl-2-oxobutanoate hydroxymethyltransferase